MEAMAEVDAWRQKCRGKEKKCKELERELLTVSEKKQEQEAMVEKLWKTIDQLKVRSGLSGFYLKMISKRFFVCR